MPPSWRGDGAGRQEAGEAGEKRAAIEMLLLLFLLLSLFLLLLSPPQEGGNGRKARESERAG